MKVMITGGAGFVGYHVANELSAKDYHIDIIDNFLRGKKDDELEELLKKKNVRLIELDLLDEKNIMNMDTDYNYIIHLAAIIGVQNVLEKPYRVLTENMLLLKNIIQLGKRQNQLKNVLFASTSEVYAGTLEYFELPIPTPETTPLAITALDFPRTSYMLSKIYGESMCLHSGLPVTIFRPHNVYGPRMGMSHVIPELLKKAQLLNNEDQLDVYSVDHQRTFCYIDDAVKMIVKLMKEEKSQGQIFNLGNQYSEVTIGQLAQIVCDTIGKTLKINPMEPTPGSPVRRVPDMTKMKQVVEFEAKVSVEDGVRRTFEWYREKGQI